MIPIPPDRIFRRVEARLVDIEAPGHVIEEVVFDGCTLYGPAIVVMSNCQMRHCVVGQVEGAGIESILWPWPAVSMVAGCMALRSCLFEHSKFVDIGFTGTPESLDAIRAWAT